MSNNIIQNLENRNKLLNNFSKQNHIDFYKELKLINNKNNENKSFLQSKINKLLNEKSKLDKEENLLKNKKKQIESTEKKNESSIKNQKYLNEKYKYNNKYYTTITGIHIIALIILFIGLLNILHPSIITVIIFICYIIIGFITYIKLNRDKNRNKFNFKEYDKKNTESTGCNYKSSFLTKKNEDEERKKEKENNKKIDNHVNLYKN